MIRSAFSAIAECAGGIVTTGVGAALVAGKRPVPASVVKVGDDLAVLLRFEQDRRHVGAVAVPWLATFISALRAAAWGVE